MSSTRSTRRTSLARPASRRGEPAARAHSRCALICLDRDSPFIAALRYRVEKTPLKDSPILPIFCKGTQEMNTILQYRATPGFRAAISAIENEWLSVAVVDETDKQTFAREIQDADVLLHVLERVTAATIEQAPRLRLIQKLGVGVDTIDLDAARARGVAVCNMPGANTRAVAELTLLLMLAALRRLCELDRQTRAGRGWTLDAELVDSLGELGGRTVGLVGFGAVGRCLTPMLQGIGANVIYTSRTETDGAPARFVALPALLSDADVVSLHVPLTPLTRAMIDDSAINSMKPGAVLVNTARGGLVDYDALHRALAGGRLRGAGLDVFESEPVNPAHPLFQLPNVFVTPHVAWFTSETLQRGLTIFLENCRRLRGGEGLLHRVV
jgi:phosphoglycerate dehydrogenase-like enzyme